MARLSLGGNVVVEEDENGDAVITNTADGTSISLESFISIVGGGLGDAANPVPGTSYFETADADSVHTEEVGIESRTDQPSQSDLPAGLYNRDGQIVVRSE